MTKKNTHNINRALTPKLVTLVVPFFCCVKFYIDVMENEETINITIPFKKIWKKNKDGNGYSGKVGLKMDDCIAKVVDENKKEHGHVASRIGGAWELEIYGDKDSAIYAMPDDIWNAFCLAFDRKDLMFNK